jgi:hypothetical protein
MHGEYFTMVHAIQISIDEVMYVQFIQCVCTYVNESKSYKEVICGVSVHVHNRPNVISLDKYPKKITMFKKN